MKEKIKKIQELPEFQRKIILWAVMFLIIILVFYFGSKIINKRIKDFEKAGFLGGLKLPDTNEIREETQNLEQHFEEFQELEQEFEQVLENKELNKQE